VLAAAVMFWVAGFDIIYAVQDVDFDREHGLHSLPVRYGTGSALGLARLFHGASFLLFATVLVYRLFPVGPLYAGGLLVMAGLLVHEHRLVGGGDTKALDLARIDRAFFRANIAVSTSFFLFTLLDRLFVGPLSALGL
jgi:4-hydroxybenzoate polyprenyltransferase